MKDEVEKLRPQIIGSLSKAQYQDIDDLGEQVIEEEADKLLTLFQTAQVEAVSEAIYAIKMDWAEDNAGDRIATTLLQIDLDERLANLKEDGETK